MATVKKPNTLDFDDLLKEFWNGKSDREKKIYSEFGGDGCGIASDDFIDFLKKEKKITNNIKKIEIGEYIKGKRVGGWFKLDVAQTKSSDLTNAELDKMIAQGLKPYFKKDVAKFIKDNNLTEDLKWIPHSWVIVNGKIFDPSGFFPEGNGQFDKLIKNQNKKNAEVLKRYTEF